MKIIDELVVAYWMEMETIQNYVANSRDLDDVRAQEIKKSLDGEVLIELDHALRLAARISALVGRLPGKKGFKAAQPVLHPAQSRTNVGEVIKCLIQSENGSIAQYNKIIKLCDGVDYATQHLCIQLLSSEEKHQRDFQGLYAEYESTSLLIGECSQRAVLAWELDGGQLV